MTRNFSASTGIGVRTVNDEMIAVCDAPTLSREMFRWASFPLPSSQCTKQARVRKSPMRRGTRAAGQVIGQVGSSIGTLDDCRYPGLIILDMSLTSNRRPRTFERLYQ